eukprot:TRINITY_DN14492_c0_g1_i3.p1 TRINITY_DN14492_c0_g1~~TRINITY_DN14492_c0_g1_i3.p1  ORF type:complete len:295 (+),score=49.99 TRINITY_DN14492_c0_g1_i3:37-885(+)
MPGASRMDASPGPFQSTTAEVAAALASDTGRKLHELPWFYLDSVGQEFGPVHGWMMREWLTLGRFPVGIDLRVRLPEWDRHLPLHKLYPDLGSAFVLPPAWPDVYSDGVLQGDDRKSEGHSPFGSCLGGGAASTFGASSKGAGGFVTRPLGGARSKAPPASGQGATVAGGGTSMHSSAAVRGVGAAGDCNVIFGGSCCGGGGGSCGACGGCTSGVVLGGNNGVGAGLVGACRCAETADAHAPCAYSTTRHGPAQSVPKPPFILERLMQEAQPLVDTEQQQFR